MALTRKVPRPCSIDNCPSAPRIETASRSEARLTPSCWARSRCAGRAESPLNAPSRIMPWSVATTAWVTLAERSRPFLPGEGPALPPGLAMGPPRAIVALRSSVTAGHHDSHSGPRLARGGSGRLLLDAPAEGELRDVAPGGGAGKAAAFSQDHEIGEPAQIHLVFGIGDRNGIGSQLADGIK